MPTKTMEVLQLPEQGSKMFVDAVLTIHERVVQVSILGETWNVFASLGSSLCTFFLLPCLSLPLSCPLNDDVLQVSVFDSSISPYVIFFLYAISFVPLTLVTVIIYRQCLDLQSWSLGWASNLISICLLDFSTGMFHRCPALGTYKLIVEELFLGL